MEVYFEEFQEFCEYREGCLGKDFCIILKENIAVTEEGDPYFETDVTCYEANCPLNKINSTFKND